MKNPEFQALNEIYNSAITPANWTVGLDLAVEHVGSLGAALVGFDATSTSAYSFQVLSEHYRSRFTPQDMAYWQSELSVYDEPSYRHSLTLPVRTVYSDADLVDDVAALESRPDYVFLRERFGIGSRRLGARLIDNNRYMTVVSFQFPVEAENVSGYKPEIEKIIPHMAKSLELGIIYERLHSRYQAVLSAIDRVGVGMCIVDSQCNVLVSNAEAERIFDSGKGVYKSSIGTITCNNNSSAGELHDGIKTALLQPESSDSLKAETVVVVREDSSDDPVVIDVSPLSDHLQEIDPNASMALVRLVDIDSSKFCSTVAFTKAYGLTKSEEQVCTLLLDGLTNQEISESRGTSVETTKSHVKSILSKSNTNSRLLLIRKILQTDPPVFDSNQ